jgi:hypothetical protein
MNSIGGYFELELRKGEEYHKNAIRLNTGRNALELILKVKQYKKVFIPYFTCDVLLEPFHKLKIDYEFYSIDEKFEPLFNYNILNGNEGFLYINYFGLKDSFISNLSENCKNLIIDNSQAFYALPEPGIPTFYSCRKFFGVPDGAYLYLEGGPVFDFPQDHSSERFKHLLKRIEFGAEAGYGNFKTNENSLIGQPVRAMSLLTQALLCNIDYEKVVKARKQNFHFFFEHLRESNELKLSENHDFVPMVFPYLTPTGKDLKQKLIKEGIFIATYWPNVLKWSANMSTEKKFTKKLLSLPIDQRYTEIQLQRVIDLILYHA